MFKRIIICLFWFMIPLVTFASPISPIHYSDREVLIDLTDIASTYQEKKDRKDQKGQEVNNKPAIATVPKVRKQSRPKVVKPKVTVKPIKVIRPKIKKP